MDFQTFDGFPLEDRLIGEIGEEDDRRHSGAIDPHEVCDLAHMADEHDATDVLGSYTGMAQGEERPVQDADDL